MNTYRIIIRNGQMEDAFSMQAKSKEDARKTAHIAHLGSGWDVVRVEKKK